MSISRSYRAVPDERLLRELRVAESRRKIESGYSMFTSVLERAAELQLESLLSANEDWCENERRARQLIAGARTTSDETSLAQIEVGVLGVVQKAREILSTTYEQELERQRVEVARRKAQSAIEAARAIVINAIECTLVTKWLSLEAQALRAQLDVVEQSFEGEEYDGTLDVCEAMKQTASRIMGQAFDEESKYVQSTEIRDRIVRTLRALGLSRVKMEEMRDGEVFVAHIIRAKDSYGRGVKSKVGKDGTVCDEFLGYDGHNCVRDVDGYQLLLKDRFGIRMQSVVKVPHDGRPLLRAKEEKQLPRRSSRSVEKK